MIARYVVIFDRELGEDDGQNYAYHNGTGQDAVRQFVKELQEAVDETGQPVGTFRVMQRVIVTSDDADSVTAHHVRLLECFEDDPLSLPDVPRTGSGEQSDPFQL